MAKLPTAQCIQTERAAHLCGDTKFLLQIRRTDITERLHPSVTQGAGGLSTLGALDTTLGADDIIAAITRFFVSPLPTAVANHSATQGALLTAVHTDILVAVLTAVAGVSF